VAFNQLQNITIDAVEGDDDKDDEKPTGEGFHDSPLGMSLWKMD
ncbi:unnamed protein product, partial [marine sediment metagenome]